MMMKQFTKRRIVCGGIICVIASETLLYTQNVTNPVTVSR